MKLDGMTHEEYLQALDEALARLEEEEREEALKQQNEVASKAE